MNLFFHENDDFELRKGAYCVLYGVRCISKYEYKGDKTRHWGDRQVKRGLVIISL